MFVTAARNLQFYGLQDDNSMLTYEPLHSGSINSLSLSKDNGFLTFIAENQKPEIISLRETNNIKHVHTISCISDVSATSFERNTKRIIGLGTTNGQVALYDTKTKAINRLFESAPFTINMLDFNADDTYLAVCGSNRNIMLYDTNKTEICESYILLNASSPTSMRFHPQDRQLLTMGTEDGSLLQLDVNSSKSIFSVQAHTAPITGLVMVPKSHCLVSVGYDHKFCIYDTNINKSIFRSNVQHVLTAVDASWDGLTIAMGTLFGDLYTYDIRKLIAPLSVSKLHNSRINKIAFENRPNSDGNRSQIKLDLFSHDHDLNVNKSKTKSSYTNCTKFLKGMALKEQQTETKTMTQAVSEALLEAAEEIRTNLGNQLKYLHNFVLNEFRSIEADIQEKWDFNNISMFPSPS